MQTEADDRSPREVLTSRFVGIFHRTDASVARVAGRDGRVDVFLGGVLRGVV